MTTQELIRLIETKKNSGRLLVLAHRGLCSLKPENSSAAIKLALKSEVTDGVEFDVQVTADDKLIIRHNLSIVIDGHRQWIKDLPLEKIRTLLSEKIAPLFNDLIPYFNKSKKIIDIEIKSTGIAKRLIGLIKDHHFYQQVILTTIYPDIYHEIRSVDKDIAVIFGYPRDRGKDLAQQKWTLPLVKVVVFFMKVNLKRTLSSIMQNIDTPFISLYHKMIDKDVINFIHEHHLYCIGATINLHDDTGRQESKKIMDRMLAGGIDCIKTDYPQII